MLIYSYINTRTRVELGKREIVWKHDARRAECFHTISSFPNSTSVDITIYQYGKNVLYIFYNIAMSKARRLRKISVFTSGGKFPVLTLSYINTVLSQSAFRIYKCYIIMLFFKRLLASGKLQHGRHLFKWG